MNNFIGLHQSQLDTPALIINKTKLLNNIQLMHSLTKNKNVNLRPHAKTHKCTTIAKLQLENGAIGICVTKISEALVMAKAGIKGLLITSPVVTTTKMNNLIALLRLAPDSMLVIDNLENAIQLNELLQKNNLPLNVLIDIDAGIGRTGINMVNVVDFVSQIIKLKNINFMGLQCYAGHIQHIPNLQERRALSHNILNKVSKIKLKLVFQQIKCAILTGSGTGTFSLDAEINEITEVQPGSYCVMDQEYNNIEYKEQLFVTAMTMLTTVISTNHKTHVTVDAGTKALYKVDTKPRIISHPHLSYDWDYFGDEHGKVFNNNTSNNHTLPQLGETLELAVACDPTINLFDYFYIVDENGIVIDRWNIDLRGCCQ